MTYPKETKDKFIELRAKGVSLANTAKELNIAQNTALNWNKEYIEEIDAAKAFEIEEMREKYRITTKKRIEIYGERLKAILDELAKRDLSNIPTNKLFEMMLKCEKALEEEIPNIEFITDEEVKEKKKYRKAVEARRRRSEYSFINHPF